MTMFQGNELTDIRSDIETLLLPETVTIVDVSHESGLYPIETTTTRETTVGRLDRLSRADSQGIIADAEAGRTFYQLSLKYDADIRDGDKIVISSITYDVIQVPLGQTNRFARRAIVAIAKAGVTLASSNGFSSGFSSGFS